MSPPLCVISEFRHTSRFQPATSQQIQHECPSATSQGAAGLESSLLGVYHHVKMHNTQRAAWRNAESHESISIQDPSLSEFGKLLGEYIASIELVTKLNVIN